ncbi:MAG: polyribonucleotide nucleotidyltransferase [Dehalococcoidales bacterium]|nr:polyribonucleotide nucleotidyltransferase [Dehalococcoidales bacterium]
MTPQSFKTTLSGKELIVEIGRVAQQAEAAVTLRSGDTVVLTTVCVSPEAREGVDFLPLTVNYEERMYAAGKIPGGFLRREGRPTDEATLASRLTDRPIRPLLPKDWRREIQIISTVLSTDQENDPKILSLIGASTVLCLSQVPFDGPVSAVHVGYFGGEFKVNPTLSELQDAELDLVIASTGKAVAMIEAGAKEVSEAVFNQAVKLGHEANQAIITLQEEITAAFGKPKVSIPVINPSDEVVQAVETILGNRLTEALELPLKADRIEAMEALKQEIRDSLEGEYPKGEIMAVFEANLKKVVRSSILDKGQRVSGRGLKEIRPLSGEVGLLPRVHGSGLFNRGETQVLSIVTLGAIRQEQMLDDIGIVDTKRFMHHYNFPPFSTGETRRSGSPGRREIGHGALVERALTAVMPPDADFPYTIRVVSEVLSSNGSTSMASTCASTLALMDAGIPIKAPVAGISIGLVTDDTGRFTLLTDIEGMEDHLGDMDFKVTGTAQGITAVQMDMKIKGLSMEIVEGAMEQAKEARMDILEVMKQALAETRSQVSPYAPRMHKIKINPEKIGTVIGPGGKMIRSIIEASGATVDIEDDGSVFVGATNEESASKAIQMITDLTREVEVGTIYTGKVTRLMNFGAFVEVLPGKEGLVHISELADYRVDKVEDIVKPGDEITVKVTDIDSQGRINLSRRILLPGAQDRPEGPPRPQGDRFKNNRSSDRPNRPGGFKR